MKKLVLIRHGQSQWNLENRFTGWTDVDLTEQGRNEAAAAGKLLKEKGFSFDYAFTSVQKRAIRTLYLALDELDQMWVPVTKAWQLNERHYGGLQGLNKAETAAEHGDEQVHIWRRSFDVCPPEIALEDERHPSHDKRYAKLSADELPGTESLKTCLDRVLPYWSEQIVPVLKANDQVIIAAHGNSLRALIKHLKGIDDAGIMGVEVPTGKPYVFELNDDLSLIKDYYLEDK